MINVHLVSNRERTNQLSAGSLFLISEPQNKYGTVWKSKAITREDLFDRAEDQFREKNFKDDLDQLDYINNDYLNTGNLSISYDSASRKIALLSGGMTFASFDSSQFVTQGMIENAYVQDGKLKIVFNLVTGGTKTVDINLSDFIDTYTPGDGLCCENKQFYINTERVSTVGHKHSINDLSDFPDDLSHEGHKHSINDISDFPGNVSYFSNDSGYLISSDISMVYDTAANTLHLSAGARHLSAYIEGGGSGGVTYAYIKNALSGDGYSLKTVFRDWT